MRQFSPELPCKVLIFGHSYARDLKTFDSRICGPLIQTNYKFIPGSSFTTYNENNKLIESAVAYGPDIVCVILGGNSITNVIPKAELFVNCRTFYETLRSELDKVNPDALIVAAQAELRFVSVPNKHETPGPEEFRLKRNYFNNYLSKLKTKDYLIVVGGPAKLDHQCYYKADGIHMLPEGLKIYASIIKSTLSFIISKNS